jgi:hypothetical protein
VISLCFQGFARDYVFPKRKTELELKSGGIGSCPNLTSFFFFSPKAIRSQQEAIKTQYTLLLKSGFLEHLPRRTIFQHQSKLRRLLWGWRFSFSSAATGVYFFRRGFLAAAFLADFDEGGGGVFNIRLKPSSNPSPFVGMPIGFGMSDW